MRRDRLLLPVAQVLARWRVSPHLLSLCGVLLAACLCWLLPTTASLALVAFLGALLCDATDGAVARLRGCASPRGKLVDQLADTSTFLLVLWALGRAQMAGSQALLLAGLAALLLLVLGFAYHTRRRPNAWRFNPRGGFLAHCPKALVYGSLVMTVLTGRPLAAAGVVLGNGLAVLCAAALTLQLWRLR